MPLPGLEWYNSFQKSMQDLFKPSAKAEISFSPRISAIQTLKEPTPGGKRVELNALLRGAVAAVRNKRELLETREFRELPDAFVPLARVHCGVELHLQDLVIEGLLSDDGPVCRKALTARWFFESARGQIEPDYFVNELLPRVSLRTRRALVKGLANALIGYGPRAEMYFERFFEAYGLEASLPFLVACSSEFIYREIIQHRIILPVKIVDDMYKRSPDVVIKYLQLANKNNRRNEEDRRFVEVRINDYETFLPKLVKKHPRDFVQLYELTPDKSMKLGNSKAERFLKSSKHILVRKPRIFLKLLPLKLVSRTLDKTEFDQMFVNMFPEDVEDFDLDKTLGLLEYYRHGDRIRLLKEKFKTAYDTAFLTDKYLTMTNSVKLAEALQPDERATISEILLERHKDNPEIVFTLRPYLPPDKLSAILMNEIKHMVSAYDRADAFYQMIVSCKIYRDTASLRKVLQFYFREHKNETVNVLEMLFVRLQENFNWTDLSTEHWDVLMRIIRHVHAKNELFNVVSMSLWVLTGALRHSLTTNDSDPKVQDEIFDLLLTSKIEHSYPSWTTFDNDQILETKCIVKFFELAPRKYPENHAIWENVNNRLSIALNVVKSINYYNKKFCSSKRSQSSPNQRRTTNVEKLKIEDYPWIRNLAEEFLQSFINSFKRRKLVDIIEKDFPDFYASRTIDGNAIQEIETGKALSLLRRDPKKILASWEAYLQRAAQKLYTGSREACREARRKAQREARRFITASKWHSDLPVKFVERSLSQAKEPGYVQVLGLLVEGPLLNKTLRESFEANADARESFERARGLLGAMRFAEPPVELTALESFCEPDYACLVEPTLSSLAERVPAERLLAFASRLADNPRTSLRKLGIRLYRKAATIDQLTKFLEAQSAQTTTSSVRLVLAKTVMEIFRQMPSERTWLLVKTFIDSLTANDKDIIESVFCDTDRVDVSYLSNYMSEFVNKIDELCNSGGLSRHLGDSCFCLAIEALSPSRASFISIEVMGKILERYFFDLNSPETSRVMQKFAIATYLLPAKQDFDKRLDTIVEAFKTVNGQFNKPHQRHLRFYPVNFMVRRFFCDAVTELARDPNRERKLRIVDSSLGLFSTWLEPSQEPSSYLMLSLFREHLLSITPKEFGSRCARKTQELVAKFSTAVIRDVAECMIELINDIIVGDQKVTNFQLSVIEGIISEDTRYGHLLAAMLLNSRDVDNYDHRYDQIIEVLRGKDDKAVQFNLYKHLNKIAYLET